MLRSAGEVLWYPFNGGDLLAVNPSTGEERVIAEGLPYLNEAMWSADGRWVAYERSSRTRSSLWVVGEDLEPRKVMDLPEDGHLARSWAWSSTGAQLAVDRNSILHVFDPATGRDTELASTTGVESAPAWSPDGSKVVLGAIGGTIYSIDVRTGERSLLVQLPVEDLASVHGIAWSPDGSRLGVLTDLPLGSAQLFVLNADGSDTRLLAEYDEGLDPRVLGIDWSPDGSRIVVAENDGTEYRIRVVPADGSMPSLVAGATGEPVEGSATSLDAGRDAGDGSGRSRYSR